MKVFGAALAYLIHNILWVFFFEKSSDLWAQNVPTTLLSYFVNSALFLVGYFLFLCLTALPLAAWLELSGNKGR